MDDTHYYATLDWTGPATFSRESEKEHTFLLQPRHTSTFSFTCCFSPEPVADVTESVASIERKSAASGRNTGVRELPSTSPEAKIPAGWNWSGVLSSRST